MILCPPFPRTGFAKEFPAEGVQIITMFHSSKSLLCLFVMLVLRNNKVVEFSRVAITSCSFDVSVQQTYCVVRLGGSVSASTAEAVVVDDSFFTKMVRMS